jgi:hypothetical protein
MGRGMNRVKRKFFRAAAVFGIVFLLVFAVGCSGDLLGYIKGMIAQVEYIGIELPKTGQTTLYELGDDGNREMGVAWPDPRFTDNGNGTITDNLTGLMWVKDGNLMITRDPTFDSDGTVNDGKVTWQHALDYAEWLNSSNYSDHNDWRLPNRKELRSLVNYGQSDTADWLNNPAQGFTGVRADDYWSSTTCTPDTTFAWGVFMLNGRVSYDHKAGNDYVLAVRGGQGGGAVSLPRTGQTTSYAAEDDGDLKNGLAWPVPRFTDNLNGTITDNLTGLMWEQSPSATSRTWTEALTYANTLSLGGHSDWRLPNVNELESLIDAGETNTSVWLNSQGFSGVQPSPCWSSTTYTPDPISTWIVNVSDGGVGGGSKTDSYDVLAVRSGQ